MILEIPENIPNDLSEDGMSAYLTQWVIQKTPLKKSYLHIANERKTSHAHGKKLQRMGVLAGAVDHFFMKPNEMFAGLWIEIKKKGQKPTREQLEFIHNRLQEGYFAFWSDDLRFIITQTALFYRDI